LTVSTNRAARERYLAKLFTAMPHPVREDLLDRDSEIDGQGMGLPLEGPGKPALKP
jgi:hypothetical protein